MDVVLQEKGLFILTMHAPISGHRSRIVQIEKLIIYTKSNLLFNDFIVQTASVKSGLFHGASTGAPTAFADPAAVVAGVSITTGVPATLTPLRIAFPGEAGSRNAFRGQGFFGIDTSLAKSWKVTERINLKSAWDVFNVTNSVRFDTNSIDNGSDDGGSGLYSGTLTIPRVQQFSLRLTF